MNPRARSAPKFRKQIETLTVALTVVRFRPTMFVFVCFCFSKPGFIRGTMNTSLLIAFYFPRPSFRMKSCKRRRQWFGSHLRRFFFSGECCLKKNQNARRPSKHPPVRGGKMSKRLVRWDHRLQIIQNLFMAFKRVSLCCLRKIRTRLDLLSIPQSGGENIITFRWDHRLAANTKPLHGI